MRWGTEQHSARTSSPPCNLNITAQLLPVCRMVFDLSPDYGKHPDLFYQMYFLCLSYSNTILRCNSSDRLCVIQTAAGPNEC